MYDHAFGHVPRRPTSTVGVQAVIHIFEVAEIPFVEESNGVYDLAADDHGSASNPIHLASRSRFRRARRPTSEHSRDWANGGAPIKLRSDSLETERRPLLAAIGILQTAAPDPHIQALVHKPYQGRYGAG